MNLQSTLQNDTSTLNERLAQTFYSSRRYNPVFLAVTGLGFIAIFILTQFRVLGEAAPQLLYIGSITLLFALAEIPVLALARQKRGFTATYAGSIVAGLFAMSLSLLWQGILPFAVLIAAATPLLALQKGLPRRGVVSLLLLLAATLVGILSIDASAPLERLQNGTSAAIASMVFLAATGLLLVTITSISQNKRFPSIQGLLLVSFIVIATVPIVMTAVLSALGTFTNSQTQTFNTLHAITTLKENQIENLLSDFQNDTSTLLADTQFVASTQETLNAADPVSPFSQESFKRLARLRMVDVLGSEEEAYSEIMVMDARGQVVISTIPEREGTSFDRQRFFQRGASVFYAGFAEEPSFGTDNMITAAPILAEDGRKLLGVLALRSNAAAIKGIMESTPGFVEAETYLVDLNFKAVTRLRIPTAYVSSEAASESLLKNTKGGRSIYANYAGEQVVGYYEWFEPMQLAIIAEVPLSFVVSNSVRALAGSFTLALLVVAIAIAAVAVSAQTIADPIRKLAETTASFAAGKLSTRAVVDRKDEIGALATAYNQMATQLQETINKLEQRVADRTKDLENQTLRLRVAAEIARDATSARDLHELLARASELIAVRFNFYHIGIFLLDSNKEYAILTASPTEAGKKMIENNHRLRVGELGIVGRVAATGEPRIALNTGSDTTFLNNSYLPDTRSEMALPLKVEGNVIGVLDVQSNYANALNEDDMAIMQIMADQLATAIERTRLLQEVQRNLKELESAYGRFTRENWERVAEDTAGRNIGYRFDNVRLEKMTQLPELAKDAILHGDIMKANGRHTGASKQHTVAIPIKLRGQTIGVISLKLKEGHDPSTVSVVETAAERLASAMESVRLYEEARRRADREQSISRVTSAISASVGYEHILQTTVREIGNVLGDAEVAIQILDEPAIGKRTGRREQ